VLLAKDYTSVYITVTNFIAEVTMKGQFIYKIINTVNGKFYVGSTTNTRERFRTHRNRLRRGRHHAKHLQAAWNKYGEAAFVFHVIQTVPETESLKDAEDIWLTEHVGKDYCYNKSRYSDAPMRGVLKEDHPNFGRIRTEEEREAISASLKEFYAKDITNHPRFGKQHTEEVKERIRQKKLANPTKAWLGKERSDETKAKISAAQKGVKKGPRTYTPEGLARAQENMRRNAKEQPRAEFAAVLAKFPQEVQEKYDFSKAVYTGALSRITGVMCPEHGEFSNYAARFRKGFGCPQCGAVVRAAKKKEEMLRTWATEEGRKMFLEPRRNFLDTPQNP
jgi:group I intron endonuclease